MVTFRPPFVYGPDNPFYREQFFWDRLRAGRPIIIPGDGHRLMQFVYVNDLVQAMVRAMEEPRAVGEAFNIGDPKPRHAGGTGGEAGARPPTWSRRWCACRATSSQQAGGNAMDEPYYFGEYFDLPPITENIGKVTRVLKMKLTPFEVGLEGDLPLVHAQPQAAHRRLRIRRQALGVARASSPASV